MAAIEPRSEGPPLRAGREPGSLGERAQLRSERGAGVVAVDELSAAGAGEVSAAGAAEVSAAAGAAAGAVVVVVVVSVGAVLFSVDAGSVVVVVVALFGIELVSVVAAGVCVVVVVVVSVDCATAAPMPASRAAEAATADNFFR